MRRAATGVLCALASVLCLLFVGATAAHADNPYEIPLTLENGWTNGPYSTGAAKVQGYDGIVEFSGAIATSGTDALAFNLPKGFRPSYNVFVPVDMCNATHGYLDIAPNGDVTVNAVNWANAQCFTSLDGVSFVQAPDPWNLPPYMEGGPLSLQNGWWTGTPELTAGPFGTAPAGVEPEDGIVHFWGAIATSGTNQVAFTLPPGLRPSQNVYVPVDLYGGANGRLDISPNGNLTVEAEGGAWSNAQMFTSLDGVTFVPDDGTGLPVPTTSLSLQNGWTGGPYNTASPQAVSVDGAVELEGAMATPGTNPVAFTLPPGFAPEYNRYVTVDMCNGTNGRLDISPSGVVTVETKGGAWGNAGCFSSLDGVSFIP
jgi:hypothetical protein